MSEKLTRTQIKNLERLGGVNPADQSFSRRQFVSQVGGTGLVVGGALAAGALTRDRWGMEGVKPPPPVRLKDYSVALPPAARTSSSSAPARRGPRTSPRGRRNSRARGPGVQRWSRRRWTDGGR